MSYEINVALNNRHFFATHQRSITTPQGAASVLKVFAEKFPQSEGYSISVSFHPNMSKSAAVFEDASTEDIQQILKSIYF